MSDFEELRLFDDDVNRRPVNDVDTRPLYALGAVFFVPQGCLRQNHRKEDDTIQTRVCPVLTERSIRNNLAYYSKEPQLELFPRIPNGELTPLQKDSAREVLDVLAGMACMGSCMSIESQADCWRRPENVPTTHD